MKVKEENEKAGLKLNIQKTKIMTSGPNISWQIDEVTVTVPTYLPPSDGTRCHDLSFLNIEF